MVKKSATSKETDKKKCPHGPFCAESVINKEVEESPKEGILSENTLQI